MKSVYIVLGFLMFALGLFAAYDLVTHSGFSKLETPLLGAWGILGPAAAMSGLVFAKFQGRRFASNLVGAFVIGATVLQTLGLIPFVQPRVLSPTPGHAGVGINEILSGLMILGGIAGALGGWVAVLVAKPME